MKITKLTEDEARRVYYGYRERLFFNQLAQHMGYELTNVSDPLSFDSWDVIYTQPDQVRCMGEIKIRKKFSDFWNGTSWLFEHIKYNAINTLCSGIYGKKAKLKGKFILCLFDGVLIWDLDNIKEEDFQIDKFRKSTVHGNLDQTDKLVTYLDKDNALQINLSIDYDQLNIDAKQLFYFNYPTSILILKENEEY